MSYSVRRLNPEEWRLNSEAAHACAFGEFRPKELERIDFALVALKDEGLVGYAQCIEMSATHLYLQYGGAFLDCQKTMAVVPCYISLIDWCSEKYKRVSTRIENTNLPMLRLALKLGFLVIGTRATDNKIFLELLKEGE